MTRTVFHLFKKKQHKNRAFIEQGYIDNIRLRKKTFYNNILYCYETQYFLTFKQNVGHRVIEIEANISQVDFDDLWQYCTGIVEKYRYLHENWEIDFSSSQILKNQINFILHLQS